MKTRIFSTMITGTVLLLGCAPTTAPITEAETSTLVTIEQPNIVPQTFMLHGEIVLGQESRTFSPCGSKEQYWLDLSSSSFERVQGLVNRPYQPLYAELIGHLAPSPKDSLAADFSGRFVVSEVNHVSTQLTERCAAPLHSTYALGDQPEWTASFEQDQIKLAILGRESRLYALTDTEISPLKREYRFNDGQLTLAKSHCIHPRSGDVFSWSATLDTQRNQYQGCAALSNGDSSHDWLGSYYATSTQNQSFSVQLTLEPDHSAFTYYHYSNGAPSTQEKGFWQQLNPNQIKVTMTHYQRQPLLSERIFTRSEQRLKAVKEKVNGVIYPIQGDGLELFLEEFHTRPETQK